MVLLCTGPRPSLFSSQSYGGVGVGGTPPTAQWGLSSRPGLPGEARWQGTWASKWLGSSALLSGSLAGSHHRDTTPQGTFTPRSAGDMEQRPGSDQGVSTAKVSARCMLIGTILVSHSMTLLQSLNLKEVKPPRASIACLFAPSTPYLVAPTQGWLTFSPCGSLAQVGIRSSALLPGPVSLTELQ